MKTLSREDALHVQAAEGWVLLDELIEAEAELKQVSPENQDHPDVLEARWCIRGEEKKWNECLQIAEALTEIVPERIFGWIHLSVSRHKLGRIQEAWDTLVPYLERMPEVAAIPYNLACYAAQLGRFEEAAKLLERAFELDKSLRQIAMEDADLWPLFDDLVRGLEI